MFTSSSLSVLDHLHCQTTELNLSAAKTYEDRHLDVILLGIEPLVTDSDRYKQRAGAETLAGLLRGRDFVIRPFYS